MLPRMQGMVKLRQAKESLFTYLCTYILATPSPLCSTVIFLLIASLLISGRMQLLLIPWHHLSTKQEKINTMLHKFVNIQLE